METIYAVVVSPQTNYLCHFGTLGQKWGIRRYQNKDGSLTALGRQRYLKNKGLAESDLTERREEEIESTKQELEKLGVKHIDKYTDTIPAGMSMQRISMNDEETTDRRKYVSFLSEDKGIYKDMVDEDDYILTYQTKKELKVATAEKVKEEIDKAIGHRKVKEYDDILTTDYGKSLADKFVKKYGDMQLEDFLMDRLTADAMDPSVTYIGKIGQKINPRDKWLRKYLDAGQKIVRDAADMVIMDEDWKSKVFYKSLKDQGYDAFVDYNDYAPGFLQYPMVVINPSDSVIKTNSEQYKKENKLGMSWGERKKKT